MLSFEGDWLKRSRRLNLGFIGKNNKGESFQGCENIFGGSQ